LTTKHKDLKTILAQKKISMGTAGLGSGTHLFALKFKENHPDKEILIIPYKSSTEALQDVLGGHIDLAYEFLGDAEAKGVKILGVTGTVKIKNYPLLKDIGYPNNSELIGVYHILVKKDVPDTVVKDLREIFNRAEKSAKFQELYKSDYSFKPTLLSDKDYDTWYTDTIKTYRTLITNDMKIE
jgi:tripartite-type tricarboxylate transporter receptor subunit TctC